MDQKHDCILNRRAIKMLALEEAKKRTDRCLCRVSKTFIAKTEAALRDFVARYVASTPFTGKTIV